MRSTITLDVLLGYEEMEMAEIEEERDMECHIEAEESTPIVFNYWGQWANKLFENAKPFFEQEGSEINAFYLHSNKISKKLLKDLELFPIWGNILSERFNYGRIPTSSAFVEGEINKIKSLLMKIYKSAVRVDQFVTDHIQYIKGKLLLINAALNKKATNISDNRVMVLEDAKRNTALKEVENWKGKGNPRIKRPKTTHTNNRSQVVNEQPDKPVCPACADGNMPGDAHKCYVCAKPVHIFIECSTPLEGEEEGYGERRICNDCGKNDNVQNIDIQLDEESKENTPRKKKTYRPAAKYLGGRKHDIKDTLQWERNRAIPIIKNGNSPQLAPVTIKNQTISLRNTCAFDSIFYLALLAAIDFVHIRNKVSS